MKVNYAPSQTGGLPNPHRLLSFSALLPFLFPLFPPFLYSPVHRRRCSLICSIFSFSLLAPILDFLFTFFPSPWRLFFCNTLYTGIPGSYRDGCLREQKARLPLQWPMTKETSIWVLGGEHSDETANLLRSTIASGVRSWGFFLLFFHLA